MWKITDQLALDAGVTNVFYQDSEVTFMDPDLQKPYKETYGKETITFALGLSYSIFK
jgi:long-subunit fatty acid transport protein